MKIGQALGAMAAYAAPTLTAQLAALREYIRVLRTTSAGRLAPVWRDDVYFVLDRLEENAIPSACPGGGDHRSRAPRLHGQSPSARTSRECWRRVTRARAA